MLIKTNPDKIPRVSLRKVLTVAKQMLMISRKGQLYIRNFMLVTKFWIILKNYSSVLSTMFYLIDLNLRCWISKLIRALWHLRHNLTNSVPCRVKALVFHDLIFTALEYGFIWFNWTKHYYKTSLLICDSLAFHRI